MARRKMVLYCSECSRIHPQYELERCCPTQKVSEITLEIAKQAKFGFLLQNRISETNRLIDSIIEDLP